MRTLFVLISVLSLKCCVAQDDFPKIYSWEEVKGTESPDTVFAVSLSRLKLDSVPEELKLFKNLRYLDLSKNKLSSLPLYLAEFKDLEVFDARKNKLSNFPLFLCHPLKISRLNLGSNDISSIPDCIKYLKQLSYLDLYDNPIRSLPESLTELPGLKELDLSGIRFSPTFQDSWNLKLPDTKIVFDSPCDCME